MATLRINSMIFSGWSASLHAGHTTSLHRCRLLSVCLRQAIRNMSGGTSSSGDGGEEGDNGKEKNEGEIQEKKEELFAKGAVKGEAQAARDKLKSLLDVMKVESFPLSAKETISPMIARPAPEKRNRPIPPPDEPRTEEEKKERELDDETKQRLQAILKMMKIDFEKKPPPFAYEQHLGSTGMRRSSAPDPARRRPKFTDLPKEKSPGLYSEDPLGLFITDKKEEFKPSEGIPRNDTWRSLTKHELNLMATPPAANAWEEMIRWTEQGKLWKFPINNEYGLDEEAKIPFYEHVMLDHKLEGFPKSGAVRIFMDRVVLGLSNNPFMTVERKHQIIDWYKDYFKSKADLFHLANVDI